MGTFGASESLQCQDRKARYAPGGGGGASGGMKGVALRFVTSLQLVPIREILSPAVVANSFWESCPL